MNSIRDLRRTTIHTCLLAILTSTAWCSIVENTHAEANQTPSASVTYDPNAVTNPDETFPTDQLLPGDQCGGVKTLTLDYQLNEYHTCEVITPGVNCLAINSASYSEDKKGDGFCTKKTKTHNYDGLPGWVRYIDEDQLHTAVDLLAQNWERTPDPFSTDVSEAYYIDANTILVTHSTTFDISCDEPFSDWYCHAFYHQDVVSVSSSSDTIAVYERQPENVGDGRLFLMTSHEWSYQDHKTIKCGCLGTAQ